MTYPDWMEPAWKRNLKRFFGRLISGVVIFILALAVPAVEWAAWWLFTIALDFDMSFGQYIAAVLGTSLILGCIAAVNKTVAE